jgi:soluble lytic murein transglycosylase
MRRRIILAVLAILLGGAADAGEGTALSADAALQAAAKRTEAGDRASAITVLLELDGTPLPAGLQPQIDLLLGLLLVREGRHGEAVPRLEGAAASYPLLADYALIHLAEAQRQLGRRDLVADALRQLAGQHPQSLFLEQASRELVREYLEAGDLARAEEAAAKYLATFPNGAGRPEVRLTLGEIFLRSGRSDQAEEAFRRIWIELPGTPQSQRAQDLLTSLPAPRPFTPDEQFQRATTLHQLGRHAQALQELSPFAVAGSPREAQARLMLGISAFNLRQYAQAAQWLEPLKDAAGPQRSEALFWLGRSAGRAGDATRFADYLTLVADATPPTRRSEEALYLLAQSAADDADIARSRTYLTRLLQEYPKGTWADVALWLQGWLAYKQREFPAAVAAWGRLLAEEPGSRWRVPALYWRGRALESLKRTAEATQAYRTLLDTAPDQPYYRLRAGERLTFLKTKDVSKSAPPASRPVRPSAASGLHAQKARALQGLGLADEAVEEWSEQVRSRPEERAGLAEACDVFLDLGRYDKAVWVGGRVLRPLFAQEGGKPPIPGFWQCVYPPGHLDLVRAYAAQRGLDPYLVLGLIREESAFVPRAISRTGARGLMQLMPQTADLTARENKLPPAAPTALETPEVNIRIGVNHLADLYREFGGNLSLTLASYNAGKQAVQRWVQRFGFADEVEFVEDIPYTETRGYVKRVLGSYERYRSLYGTQQTESRAPRAEKKSAAGR